MKDKLIITSGGMDSVTLLHQRKDEIKKALSFYYGQKHKKELEFARKNCEKLGIDWALIDLSALLPHLKSNLLDGGGAIPEGHYEDENQKLTVVPFRNGIMLAIACGIAESCGCKYVLIANHAGDHAIYPDCRDSFIGPMAEAMHNGTYANIQLQAPYTYLTKRDIGLIGRDLGVNYGDDTWTCYKGGLLHCGKCGACTERKEALEGFDGTFYEA
jgi:7-cyano-7-deazaguanine synthase